MFGRRQKPAAPVPSEDPAHQDSPGTQAVMRHVQLQLREKPLLGAQIASKEIVNNLYERAKNERGMQIELLATILGGLAGRASLLAALAGQASGHAVLGKLTLNRIGIADGSTLLMGDAINYQLAESTYSVFGLIAGYLQSIGEPVPDAHEYFAYGARTVGKPEFGIPRYAEGTGVPDSPLAYAQALWAPMSESLRRYAPDPQLWPVTYGFALQQMLGMAKGNFDLQVLVRVAMDSALAVAKVPLQAAA
jgi:hypothetical protein